MSLNYFKCRGRLTPDLAGCDGLLGKFTASSNTAARAVRSACVENNPSQFFTSHLFFVLFSSLVPRAMAVEPLLATRAQRAFIFTSKH